MAEILRTELIAKVSNFIKGMRDAALESESVANRIDKATDKISKAVTSNISGVFSTAAIVSFGKAVLDATAEYQKFGAVLSNTLGSAALSNLKLKEIQQFAAETPFGVNELTGAFVKLANAGFKPTGDQMRKLGDLASSTGKSFDQLAEAIIDAQTGEFERLKEFGVRAKDAGDSVIFTYKGVQTQVEKTSGSIRNYITSLGAAEGTSGSMAKISETLEGKISNLGDSWDQMLISFGKNTSGVFSFAIGQLNTLLSKITEYNEQINRVSKYKLGSNTAEFFRGINRTINPFADRVTEIEKANYDIAQLEKTTGAFVSKTSEGAKSVADFGKALARLKKESDDRRAEFAPPDLLGGRDNSDAVLLFKRKQNAIQRVYQDAIDAIIDARKNYIKEANTPDANFGTKKGDKDEIAEIYKRLASELKSNPLDFGATKIEIAIANIQSYQTAIKGLIANGFDPASKAISELIAKQDALAASFRGGDLQAQKLDIPALLGVKDKEFSIKPVLNIAPIVVGVSEFQKRMEDFGNSVSTTLSAAIVDGLAGIGEAIGAALAAGTSVINAVGLSMLESLGNLLTQLGKIAIQAGVGLLAIKEAFESLNPFIAIAAGVALVAFGSLIRGSISNLGKNNSTSSNKNNSVQFKPFAKGGIVYGPTFAQVGEYAGASSNPEVIAPLNKLKDLIPGNQSPSVSASIGISMRELVVKIRQEEKLMGRMG
ncbi:MAG: hypothetical protein J7577_00890 [Sphingobacteriaceae bacterium]|nr:hypothetical protein [Sphingobacteriaceae bacterium]